ncbi:unnamed protein product [Ceratitis capitata]|uniref:(Mediterranean fruit fly) hypothetical protein n=1 Tax=Ceratitis capitata TaxID=7213 RepID=A0A811V0H8_CERCA|nr:unnamed protein product [Ceratitis capitata]
MGSIEGSGRLWSPHSRQHQQRSLTTAKSLLLLLPLIEVVANIMLPAAEGTALLLLFG